MRFGAYNPLSWQQRGWATRERGGGGAGFRPDCVVWAGAVVAFLVVALLPLGAWVVLGAWRFPLGGGLGWW